MDFIMLEAVYPVLSGFPTLRRPPPRRRRGGHYGHLNE